MDHINLTRVTKFSSLNQKATSGTLLPEYIKIFYSQLIDKDFAEYSDEKLFFLAASSFEFFSQKPVDDFKIRIYNPTKANDGFECSNTILDIVNDDMSFLVDSVVMQINICDIKITNIIHPILTTTRSDDGKIISFVKKGSIANESIMQLHLTKISDDQINYLQNRLTEVLASIKLVVTDWKKMLNLAIKSSQNFRQKNSKIFVDGQSINNIRIFEAANFIDWIVDDKFIFLGAIEFDIVLRNGEYSYSEVPNTRFGTYRSPYQITKPISVNVSSQEIDDVIKNPYLIEILKSHYKSQIHRFANAERIRIQKFDDSGKVVGEYRFVGLFPSSVYYQSPKLIPIISRKIEQVIAKSGYSKNSSNFKDLVFTLESYPRDELFQIEQDDLLRITTGIVAMSGRNVVRIFNRYDKFSRFVIFLVFVPRDRFNTSLKEKIQDLVAVYYNGIVSDIFVKIVDSNLTRLHIVVRTDNGIPDVNYDELEKKLVNLCKIWFDEFCDEVNAKFLNIEAKKIIYLCRDAFSVSYKNRFNPKDAIKDIKHISKSLESSSIICDLYKTKEAEKDIIELKIYSPKNKLLLSDIMPILDSFGFNVVIEHTYLVSLQENQDVWVHYFNLTLNIQDYQLSEKVRTNFIEIITKIWLKETKIGHFNRLVFVANLDWKKIYLIRAYSKYLYQVGLCYDQNQLSDVFVKHNDLVRLLVDLFEAKFDPSFTLNKEQSINKIIVAIENELEKVSETTEDNIIRRFFNIIQETLRTNFYQKNIDGKFKNYLSFKLNSTKIIGLPLPIMHAEIFVYSVDFEGIHLRGGKVARGGIRWSDRHDDFRTEVLGLVKAQMTKNAVIVPVGSKGGFVIKKSNVGLDRDQVLQNAIDAYKLFLKGLLDLTDNVIDGKIINPPNVIKYDDDDPYLVVAADRGTATFSDIANSISAEYNFWLGDAFASGGSVGYDHKKMGITAKGAWVSVKRHFAGLGIDTQSQDFTCIGIGDLSGDVFGNGMLLSKHIKLIAAFNHLHIFIDPNPDTKSSFIERQRMFSLSRSRWADYDQSKISKGGGIFERSNKTIILSIEAQQALSIKVSELSPNDLISLILKAPVDLLWSGGIGTYVKASDESDADVGDRVNDILRINGSDLKSRVVGEGGNLGFTQKGRIEASLAGVLINTDAMDNSAGVDCSDHEVNIKITLTAAMKSGKISLDERNKILEQMTDEVAELVLIDNKNQTNAIAICYSQGYLGLGNQAQFLNNLEQSGSLNRRVEFLPNNKEIAKRQADKIGMTRPELCVMLAYSKMDLYPQILSSNLVKDPYLDSDLFNYFPKLLQEKFSDEIEIHQLRSEIIATSITNSIVNKAGITFVNQIINDTGFLVVDVVRNFIIVYEVFSLDKIWNEIEELGSEVSSEIKSQMFLAINKLLERSIVWMLRSNQKYDISTTILKYQTIVKQLFDIIDEILVGASKDYFDKKVSNYCEGGISKDLSRSISAMDSIASSFDIVEIARLGSNIKATAKIYFEVGDRFSLKFMRGKASSIIIDNDWKKLSIKTILEDLYQYQAIISKQIAIFTSGKDYDPKKSISEWISDNHFLMQRYDVFIAELKEQHNLDLSMFVIALNRVKALLTSV
jgi:glutamate dehydrogenase